MGFACNFHFINYPATMVKARKIPPLKVRESTALSRAMANPYLRFAIAGFSALFITIILFIFMIYITDNFRRYSNSTSQTLFSLDTIVINDDSNQRRIRVQRPPEVLEQPEITDADESIPLIQTDEGLFPSQQDDSSTFEQNVEIGIPTVE